MQSVSSRQERKWLMYFETPNALLAAGVKFRHPPAPPWDSEEVIEARLGTQNLVLGPEGSDHPMNQQWNLTLATSLH